MKNIPYLIFDFDGTLVDSFDAVISKFNLLADEFKFHKIQSNEIKALRELTSKELISHLKIPMYKLPRVLQRARKQLCAEMLTLRPFKGIPEMLQVLHEMKIPLGILTSNASKNVREWLQHNNLQHLFRFIHIESSYFGKKRILQKIIQANNIDKSQAFYIGDETRDIEAAKGCEIYSVAVTWGFNSEKILSQHQPHSIARAPEDILSIIK